MDIREIELLKMLHLVDTCVRVPKYTYLMQQNAPRPKGHYGCIKCISSTAPGRDHIEYINEEDKFIICITGIRVVLFDILFSRNGQEYIDFDSSFYRPDVHDKMKELGLFFMEKTPLSLHSLPYETHWEFRQGIRVKLNILREHIGESNRMYNAFVKGKYIETPNVIDMEIKNNLNKNNLNNIEQER